jgi:hypothetical protein
LSRILPDFSASAAFRILQDFDSPENRQNGHDRQ